MIWKSEDNDLINPCDNWVAKSSGRDVAAMAVKSNGGGADKKHIVVH